MFYCVYGQMSEMKNYYYYYLKFIWSCINSNNTIVKSVCSSAIMYSFSSLGENYRFLPDKYDI